MPPAPSRRHGRRLDEGRGHCGARASNQAGAGAPAPRPWQAEGSLRRRPRRPGQRDRAWRPPALSPVWLNVPAGHSPREHLPLRTKPTMAAGCPTQWTGHLRVPTACRPDRRTAMATIVNLTPYPVRIFPLDTQSAASPAPVRLVAASTKCPLARLAQRTAGSEDLDLSVPGRRPGRRQPRRPAGVPRHRPRPGRRCHRWPSARATPTPLTRQPHHTSTDRSGLPTPPSHPKGRCRCATGSLRPQPPATAQERLTL
ncbi:hypothetical protein SAMN05421684_7894 [Asanoa ishikariensis]|uniref:Uncharacterized protein n=1 Tax=Asanoa ishikariensis TaxID=137265 RepID=A0A1H3URJ7_9ACTN|nr:hypothetical protein SAMN05421684_7894 [Asanoa ishikariensis]